MTPLAFDWDEGNTGHIARHDVTTDEAEQVVAGERLALAFQDRHGELRRRIIGRTRAGRVLVVVYHLRRGKVRVVTAHTAKATERRKLDGGP
jgi:uncharacterized DUF497 family protein